MENIKFLLLAAVLILTLSGCSSVGTTSETSTTSDVMVSDVEEPKDEELKVEETKQEETTPSAVSEATNNNPSTPTTNIDTSTNQTAETQPETTPTPTVVQAADPNTGISWDGVSPIIYTYPDGSTGTIPRPGAKYEYTPGVFRAVPPDLTGTPEYDGVHCMHCGKVGGDGSNGTCLRYISSGDNCLNCGVFVPANTCHTCN